MLNLLEIFTNSVRPTTEIFTIGMVPLTKTSAARLIVVNTRKFRETKRRREQEPVKVWELSAVENFQNAFHTSRESKNAAPTTKSHPSDPAKSRPKNRFLPIFLNL